MKLDEIQYFNLKHESGAPFSYMWLKRRSGLKPRTTDLVYENLRNEHM